MHGHSLSLFEGVFQSTLHVEGRFWIVVSLSFQKCFETGDVLFKFDEFTLSTCEDFGHEEGLRQELLDFSSSGDSQLVVF